MYRRFVVVMGAALCGVLTGCSSISSVPKHAPGPGPNQPITIHAGTVASWTTIIEAAFHVDRAGTYRYVLAYARVPPQSGAQPEVCLPETGFRLTSDGGIVTFLGTGFNTSGNAAGSVQLSVGRWTASSGLLGLEQLQGDIAPPSPPPGSFWSGACPWFLTLSPSS
jgi:hypothetical protein